MVNVTGVGSEQLEVMRINEHTGDECVHCGLHRQPGNHESRDTRLLGESKMIVTGLMVCIAVVKPTT